MRHSRSKKQVACDGREMTRAEWWYTLSGRPLAEIAEVLSIIEDLFNDIFLQGRIKSCFSTIHGTKIMQEGKTTKIHSSAFKHIVTCDMCFHSFATDWELFSSTCDNEEPTNEDEEAFQSSLSSFLNEDPYCSQFALSTGDMTPRRYDYMGKYMEFTPGPTGFPTVRDFDIMLYCNSWLGNAALEDRLDDISDILEFEIEDFYAFSGRARSGDRDEAFVQALERLQSSTMRTNTNPYGRDPEEITSQYLKEYKLVRDEKGRIKTVTLQVSKRTCILLEAEAFVLYHKDFVLQSPMRRAIYMYMNISCVEGGELTLSFAKLHRISGSTRPLRKVSEVIDDLLENPLPGFLAEVNEEDETVTFDCEFKNFSDRLLRNRAASLRNRAAWCESRCF